MLSIAIIFSLLVALWGWIGSRATTDAPAESA